MAKPWTLYEKRKKDANWYTKTFPWWHSNGHGAIKHTPLSRPAGVVDVVKRLKRKLSKRRRR